MSAACETGAPVSTAGLPDVWTRLGLLVPRKDKVEIEKHVVEIRNRCRRGIEDVIEIGRRLTLIKGKLPHGCFLSWVESEFRWSERTAQSFMRVYALADKYKYANFADLDLPVSGLYLLAEPKTPEAAINEVVECAQKGCKFALEDVRD
jgi:hypothetical protein